MAEQVNIYDAKTSLSKLIERVEAGEEIVIARSGRPVAQLVPIQRSRPNRAPGSLRGRVHAEADIDAVDDDIAAMIENGDLDPPAPR